MGNPRHDGWNLPDCVLMSDPADVLRKREGEASDRVSFLELFFDLVFVFAVTQLSHSLIGDFSPLGMLHTLILMLAVWWVWVFTTWVTNWLDPEKMPVRLALLGLMVLGLVLSASLPRAFDSRGGSFAGAYIAMQLGRTLFVLWSTRRNAHMVENFRRILAWLVFSSLFWISGSMAAGNLRMLLWGLALLIEYASPSLGFRTPWLGRSRAQDWDVAGHHIAERCGLFIIIALGESVLVTGATFADLAWTPLVVTAFLSSLAGSIAMWWLYFDAVAEAGTRKITEADNPARLARLGYTYLHLFPVAGIILGAVADELVLAHPADRASWQAQTAILGGPGLYLLGSLFFKTTIFRKPPLSHAVGIAALGLAAWPAQAVQPWMLSVFSTVVLIAVAAWEKTAACPTLEPE